MIAPEVLDLVSQAPFVPIVTLAPDGTPHMIVSGRVAEVDAAGDLLTFRAAVMKRTRENLKTYPYMQVVLAVRGATPRECRGFRLVGEARVEGDLVRLRIVDTKSLV